MRRIITSIFALPRLFLRPPEGCPAGGRTGPFLALVLMMILVTGCSARSWIAQMYMVRAEETSSKAYAMRVKKEIPYATRLKYYRKACDYFMKSYDYGPKIFTLYRIETAAEACRRVEDREKEQVFLEFEERYAKEHPTEVEYGDAFNSIVME